MLRWEKEQPLSPIYWKISCPLSLVFRRVTQLHTPNKAHNISNTSAAVICFFSLLPPSCAWKPKGMTVSRAHKYMYPQKHVLMEKVQPRQIGATQWPSLQPQFCCLSQLQFSQEPEGKEDRREHYAMNPVQDSTWEKNHTIFTGSEEET